MTLARPLLTLALIVGLASQPTITAPADPVVAQSVERPNSGRLMRSPQAPGRSQVRVLPAGSLPAAGAIGSVLLAGWAAFCDPTPKRCQSWGDGALVGAMPSFSFGDEPFLARVCALAGECVVVTVLSFCACGDRHGDPTVIDLSPAAMRRIAGPDYRRLGIIQVTVEWPVDELPSTDTAEGSIE